MSDQSTKVTTQESIIGPYFSILLFDNIPKIHFVETKLYIDNLELRNAENSIYKYIKEQIEIATKCK